MRDRWYPASKLDILSTTPRYPKTPGQVKQGVSCADFYEKRD